MGCDLWHIQKMADNEFSEAFLEAFTQADSHTGRTSPEAFSRAQ